MFSFFIAVSVLFFNYNFITLISHVDTVCAFCFYLLRLLLYWHGWYSFLNEWEINTRREVFLYFWNVFCHRIYGLYTFATVLLVSLFYFMLFIYFNVFLFCHRFLSMFLYYLFFLSKFFTVFSCFLSRLFWSHHVMTWHHIMFLYHRFYSRKCGGD